MWSVENKMWLPLKLEATDHNWFPTTSLYSIRTKKRQEKSNKHIFLIVKKFIAEKKGEGKKQIETSLINSLCG